MPIGIRGVTVIYCIMSCFTGSYFPVVGGGLVSDRYGSSSNHQSVCSKCKTVSGLIVTCHDKAITLVDQW